MPVRSAGGKAIGTLCVIDVTAHTWTHEDAETLVELAAALTTELEVRTVRRQIAEVRRFATVRPHR